MSAVLAYARAGLLGALAYRSGLWLTLLGAGVLVTVQVLLWKALTAGHPQSAAYVLFAVLARTYPLVYAERAVFDFVARRVREGELAIELTRPVGLAAAAFGHGLGHALFRALFLALPAGLVGLAWAWGDLAGVDAGRLRAFLPAFALAFSLAFLINHALSLLALWIGRPDGVLEARDALALVLGGGFVPLGLYPAWLKTAALASPFAAVYYAPAAALAGLEPYPLTLQAFWVLALALLTLVLSRRARARAVLAGG